MEDKKLEADTSVIEEPRLEKIVKDSTTSTIVLCILAHGEDLPDMLNEMDYEGKLNNTLFFSVANKSCATFDFITLKSNFSKMKDLYIELNQKKRQISQVVRELEIKSSSESTDPEYNYKTYLSKALAQLKGQTKGQIDRVKELAKKEISTKKSETRLKQYTKIQSEIEELEANRERDIGKCMISCEKNLTNKSRFIKNDRLYESDNGDGIFVLDIRNPNSETQNKYEEISKDLSTVNKLSDILRICYTEYKFDYVTIFDFACRGVDVATCNNVCSMESCIDCSTTSKEIEDGKRVMEEYEKKKLGGMKRKTSRKTNRKTNNKNKEKSNKRNNKARTKKTRVKK